MFATHFFALGSWYVAGFTSFEGRKAKGQASLLHRPALSQKPIARRGSSLQMALPSNGKCCLPTTFNSFISLLFIIPCLTAESEAKLFCHMLLPQMMVRDQQIFSYCGVFQSSPVETRDVIKSKRWCKDTLLTAGFQAERLVKCKRVSLSCYIRQLYFNLKVILFLSYWHYFPTCCLCQCCK